MRLNIPLQFTSHVTFPALRKPIHPIPQVSCLTDSCTTHVAFAPSLTCMYPQYFHSDTSGVRKSLLLYYTGSAPARCDLNHEISINQHSLHPKRKTFILLKQKAKKRNHPDLAEQLMRCPRLFPLSTSTYTEVVALCTSPGYLAG